MKKNYIKLVVIEIVLVLAVGYISIITTRASGYTRANITGEREWPLFSYPGCDDKLLLVFIIDFNDFMCHSCLESFLDIYNSLPAPYQFQRAWGVVSLGEEDSFSEKRDLSLRILEKKIRGFVTAHAIRMPLLIDRDHIFQSFSQDGSTLILFDVAAKSIVKFILPLTPGQKQHLSQVLIQGRFP